MAESLLIYAEQRNHVDTWLSSNTGVSGWTQKAGLAGTAVIPLGVDPHSGSTPSKLSHLSLSCCLASWLAPGASKLAGSPLSHHIFPTYSFGPLSINTCP